MKLTRGLSTPGRVPWFLECCRPLLLQNKSTLLHSLRQRAAGSQESETQLRVRTCFLSGFQILSLSPFPPPPFSFILRGSGEKEMLGGWCSFLLLLLLLASVNASQTLSASGVWPERVTYSAQQWKMLPSHFVFICFDCSKTCSSSVWILCSCGWSNLTKCSACPWVVRDKN